MSTGYKSFSKQSAHPFKDTVLFWVVWVIFARNLKDCRESIRKRLDCWSDPFGDLYQDKQNNALVSRSQTGRKGCPNVLVDQQYSNVFPLSGERVKRLLDSGCLRL